jgi:hypothetical protein
MRECKMVGYYHDLEDINLYADKSADEIVADFLNGKGTIVYESDFVELYFGGWNIEVTTDGKYAVVKDINYCDNFTDFEEGNCYIDIYEIL